ncbi:peptidylprolyl isomerase [Sphingomonas sp. RB3P16]|uniref:peptidylprolyl isomerase n=1 Tax=Parasphingomonas frigoris TaxID=3096163 RepID=UPI002FC9E2D0
MRFVASLLVFLLAFVAGPAFADKKKDEAKSAVVTTAGRPPIPSASDPENLLYLDLSTGGRVIIWLRPDAAPKMVERVKTLTRQHFYDNLLFHRVIEGFMAQTGDPKGDGTGGSTLPNVPAEFNWLPHVRGAVSAAREGSAEGATVEQVTAAENSANSQFFIVFNPNMKLDRKYTVFGRVISGMEYVDAITRGEPPTNPSRIVHAYIGTDNPPAYVPAPPAMLPPATLAPSKPAIKPMPKAKPAAAPRKKAA